MEEKQNYLRQNILDKGYDANEFVAFLQSKKGEAASDITNWSMKDLHIVVQEFISEHNQEKEKNTVPQSPITNNTNATNNTNTTTTTNATNNTHTTNETNNTSTTNVTNNTNTNNAINTTNTNVNDNSEKNISAAIKNISNEYEIVESNAEIKKEMNNIKKEKENFNKFTSNDENFGIIIPEFADCQKSETNELNNHKNVEITVTDPQKINNGFFSKTFVNFLITTNPVNLKVRRKHADFVWLRERLSIIFNLNVLPRLPRKGKVNGDTHLNKRMRNLEKFLNYLLKDNLIKNSKIFYDFLSIVKDEDFEKQKKVYNKLKTPIEIKDAKTLDGKIKIQVTPEYEKLFDKIKNNAALNEAVLKQINDNFKLLKLEMDATISRISSFFPMFDKLIKIRRTYLPNNLILESYIQIKNIFASWLEVLKKQNNFFYRDVKEYLKILGGNYQHMKELSELVDEQKTYYKRISKNLIAKKMDLFERSEVSDWQLDAQDKKKVKSFYKDKIVSYKKICYSNTCDTIKLKEKYGYQLNKIISEHERLKSIVNFENRQKVMDFTRKQSQISSDHIIVMGKIIGIMDDCIEDQNKEDKEQNEVIISETQDEENNFENNNEENNDDGNTDKINEQNKNEE